MAPNEPIEMVCCPFCQDYFPEVGKVVCDNCEDKAARDLAISNILSSLKILLELRKKDPTLIENRRSSILMARGLIAEMLLDTL